MEEAATSTGCRNVLVVTGSAAEEVAEFVVLPAEPVGRVVLLEAAQTLVLWRTSRPSVERIARG